MFRRAGAFVTRHPRLVLVGALVFLVLSVLFGTDATGRLKTQGYDDPRSESSRAAHLAAERLGASPNLVLVAQSAGGSVDGPDARGAGRELTGRLAAQPHVSAVASYWTGGAAELRSRDGHAAMLVAHVDGEGEELAARAERLRAELAGPTGAGKALTVHVGGSALVDAELQDISESDLKRAESVVLPGTLILLVLVFGSVVAAALPLLIGVLAVAGTLLVLSVLGRITDVSVFALNLTTALGLGLGIDYGLLIVSRFREELAAGFLPSTAAVRTVRTAGHTIAFSAATVSAALATLLVFPPYFLRSFAYAGIAVVAIAAVSAVTVLPALLALLGKRVNAWAVPWRRKVRSGSRSGFWEGLARIVVRRPLIAALPVIGLLVLLAAPFAHADFATPDDRALPSNASGRQTGDLVRERFDMKGSGALTVVTTGDVPPPERVEYARRLSAFAQVAQVVGPDGGFRYGERAAVSAPAAATARPAARGPVRLSVVPLVDPQSHAAQQLVHDIRAIPAPAGTEVLVGGPSAVLVDAKATVGDRIPLALALISLTTFALLLGFTRSLLLPLKAIALNALSLAAVLGAMVWVFQSGHLHQLLGFTPGPLSTTMPVLLFCIVFGLSVDYEVFVLARIKEAHEAGQDNARSIVTGMARTGGIVTTAGALLAFTLLGFGTSQVSLLQFFGIGAGLGVLLDATLVRGVLVPALMRLAGGLNWWAPRPIRPKEPLPASRPPPAPVRRCPAARPAPRTPARARH
ncbi:membrane protein [Streptomyces nojiriensis]|uniref:Membrane protein n=1 Tax=Streptomyces nojiriensis TaxID=66374 RepID=A0ABQ3SRN6_9ACTN|nr:MMPL family transporter [Streptomyces nojiriensis]QTI43972.1 Trehalose monomycolate exporter MmpL3 [Streptomyces nojiriensis]GGR85274.1 membrane protein [Streptomyces nojiriensis]GHI70440.1 membrane protein [Streptomyces nojiriensis]